MAAKFIIGKSENKKFDSWTVVVGWILMSFISFPIVFMFIDSALVLAIYESFLLIIAFLVFRYSPSDSILFLKQQNRESHLTSTQHKDINEINDFNELEGIKKIIERSKEQ